MDLKDKTALVTGASRGIGKQMVISLIEKGASVIGIARNSDRLIQLGSEVGVRFHGFSCDVSDEEQVKKVSDEILSIHPQIDVLINNAGVGRFGDLEKASTEDWDVQLDVNLKGVFLLTRLIIPVMKKQNNESGFGGHIINVASIAGLIGHAGLSIYNATKFGLRGFSDALMKELRYDGIKVSCIYPGSIETSFFDEIEGIDAHSRMMQAKDVSASVMHILESPENYLISEMVMRPFRPKADDQK